MEDPRPLLASAPRFGMIGVGQPTNQSYE